MGSLRNEARATSSSRGSMPEVAPTSEPLIRLKNLHKRFGRLEVLTGVDLDLRPGETTVVLGESGTGKSVLLKHMVGLLRPDVGEVHFHGKRVDAYTEREWVEPRKHFGFLFQLSALFDSLTVGENVGFPLTVHTRKSKSEIERSVEHKLTMVGLSGLQRKRVAELSGGQRKRVALARAIALDPEVILYDEPTTGLDPPRADVINELILRMRRSMRATGVVVTHDLTSAFKVADRIVMLHQGRLIFDGTEQQIRRSTDPRVKRFIEGRASTDDLEALDQRAEV